MQADGIMVEYDRSQQQQSTEPMALPDARSHPFLRWAVGHPNSPSWTAFGSIRHANIVQFEFQYHNHCAATTFREEGWLLNEDPSFKAVSNDHSIRISREQLDDVASIWGTRIQPAWGLGLARAMRATFYFQTYCNESSWQIKRVLHCIIWEAEQLPVSRHCNTGYLMTAMLQVRNIRGKDSVWLALRSTGLILRPKRGEGGLEWVPFVDSHLPENTFDILSGLAAGRSQGVKRVRRVGLDNGLFWTATVLDNQHQCVPASWGKDTRTGDCLVAIRSSSWPDTSPRFCLFVLSETDYESRSELLRFLEKAVLTNSYYADNNCQWGEHDLRTIRDGLCQWREALALEGTNIA
jgi:hypothetical protein